MISLRETIGKKPSGLAKKFTGVIAKDFFFHLSGRFCLFDKIHRILELLDGWKITTQEHLVFPHRVDREANLLGAPKRGSRVNEEAFFVFVEEALGAFVPE